MQRFDRSAGTIRLPRRRSAARGPSCSARHPVRVFGSILQDLCFLKFADKGLLFGSQNIASEGVTRKIFRNKELALRFAARFETPIGAIPCMPHVGTFRILSKGCSSHEMGSLLWKSRKKSKLSYEIAQFSAVAVGTAEQQGSYGTLRIAPRCNLRRTKKC